MKKSLFLLVILFLCLLVSCGNSSEFNREKEIVYEVLSTKYAGYDGMLKKGFSKKIFKNIKTREELKEVLYKYVDDFHLHISIDDERIYYPEPDKDISNKSQDPDNFFNCIKTANTFYVRCNSCTSENPDYEKLGDPSFCYNALAYDYIVLDFRSNKGGNDEFTRTFFQVLAQCSYSGKIIILQDRWTFSSGEIYSGFYHPYYLSGRFTADQLVLVGTNSGGAQLYGNCELVEQGNVKFWLPTTNFEEHIAKVPNYEGEGKGYKPDIYALKENLKQVIENLGADLTGIDFK
ncbi:MAG: hypothetical protein MJ185_00360 [Treponema sp.]|nr:hypothetical protein [Treponema sp.]